MFFLLAGTIHFQAMNHDESALTMTRYLATYYFLHLLLQLGIAMQSSTEQLRFASQFIGGLPGNTIFFLDKGEILFVTQIPDSFPECKGLSQLYGDYEAVSMTSPCLHPEMSEGKLRKPGPWWHGGATAPNSRLLVIKLKINFFNHISHVFFKSGPGSGDSKQTTNEFLISDLLLCEAVGYLCCSKQLWAVFSITCSQKYILTTSKSSQG